MIVTRRHARLSRRVLQPIFVILLILICQTSFAKKNNPLAPDHPIITRCLPNSPCLLFPDSLINLDNSLQKKIAQTPLPKNSWLNSLEWLTESSLGILIQILFFVFLGIFCLKISKPNPKVFISNFALFALLMGGSDLFSSEIKSYVGRLKPHVISYHPLYQPALSFPSNHAFNTSVFFMLSLIMLKNFENRFRHSKIILFTTLLIYTFAIAYSRVILGQHYPSDVIAGIFFGMIYGAFVGGIWKFIQTTFFWRHTKP